MIETINHLPLWGQIFFGGIALIGFLLALVLVLDAIRVLLLCKILYGSFFPPFWDWVDRIRCQRRLKKEQALLAEENKAATI